MLTICMILLHIVIATLCFDYSMRSLADWKPWLILSVLAGNLFSFLFIPVAIVCWFLRFFGFNTKIFVTKV